MKASEEATPKKSFKVSSSIRCLAKGIDLAAIVFFSVLLPYPLGVFLAFIYTLVHDGFFKGQSLGKKLMNLQVVYIPPTDSPDKLETRHPCTYRESIIRNSPLGVAIFFGIIPFWGWIILILLGFPLIGLELYLLLSNPQGSRLGDVMADTRVIDLKNDRF